MKKQRQNRNAKAGSEVTVSAPTKRGRRAKRITASVVESLQQINLHAAGVDVGSAENFVCVPAQAVKSGQPNVRSFGAFTKNLDGLVEHYLHALEVMGPDHVGVGTDFDGMPATLTPLLDDAAGVPRLWEALARKGLGAAVIEKVAWRNFARLLPAADVLR